MVGASLLVENVRRFSHHFELEPAISAQVARDLDRAIDELRLLGGDGPGDFRTSAELAAAARAEHLISEMKRGLGVR